MATLVAQLVLRTDGGWTAVDTRRLHETASPAGGRPVVAVEVAGFSTDDAGLIARFATGGMDDAELARELAELVERQRADTTAWQKLEAPVGATAESRRNEGKVELPTVGRIAFHPPQFTVMETETLTTGDIFTLRGEWTGDAWRVALDWDRRTPSGRTEPAWMDWDDPFSGQLVTVPVPRVLNGHVRGVVRAEPGEVVLVAAVHRHVEEANESSHRMQFAFVRTAGPPTVGEPTDASPPEAFGRVDAVVLRVPREKAIGWLRQRASDAGDEQALQQWVGTAGVVVEDAACLTGCLLFAEKSAEALAAHEDWRHRADSWDSRVPATELFTASGVTWSCETEGAEDGQRFVSIRYARTSPGAVLRFPWQADRPDVAIERETTRCVSAAGVLPLDGQGAQLVFALPAPEAFEFAGSDPAVLLGFATVRASPPAVATPATRSASRGAVQVAFASVADAEAATVRTGEKPEAAATVVWKCVDAGTARLLAFTQTPLHGHGSSVSERQWPGWDTGLGGERRPAFMGRNVGLLTELRTPERGAPSASAGRFTLVATLSVAPPRHPAVADFRSPASEQDGEPFLPECFDFDDTMAIDTPWDEWRLVRLQPAHVPDDDARERGRWHAMMVRWVGGK